MAGRYLMSHKYHLVLYFWWMAAGVCMWESEMFTKDQMVAWENKPTADQTWDNLQTYFTEKYHKRRQYLAATANQSRIKEAALAAQGQESAEKEGASNDVCTPPRPTQIATWSNGHSEQGNDGCDDGTHERHPWCWRCAEQASRTKKTYHQPPTTIEGETRKQQK
jgi:hypothetical protein